MGTFAPLAGPELKELKDALEANGGDGTPLTMGRDTSFVVNPPDEPNANVINSIQGVACHY